MLAVQIEIARRLGPTGAGRVATALAVVAVLAVLGRFGSDQLVMRRVATRESPNRVRADYSEAVRLSLPLLSLGAVLLFLFAEPIASICFGDPSGFEALRWLAPALPAFGLVAVQGEAIKGLGHPGWGSMAQSLVGPVVTVALLLTFSGTRSLAGLSTMIAAGYLGSCVVAHLVWRWLLRRIEPTADEAHAEVADTRVFAREAWPFFGTSVFALVLVYAPVLSLAVLGDPADVGRYFAADRWTQISAMLLVAVNAVVGPRFAGLWVRREIDEIRTLLIQTTAATALAATAISATMILGAPWLMSLFGPGYESAVPALRLLAVGQFVVLAAGPVTSLLVMTGGERAQRGAAATAAVIIVILCLVFVPTIGLTGAAIAGAVAAALNKTLIVVMLRATLKTGHGVARAVAGE